MWEVCNTKGYNWTLKEMFLYWQKSSGEIQEYLAGAVSELHSISVNGLWKKDPPGAL